MAYDKLITFTVSKGRVVIPLPVRRKLGIIEGTRIQVEVDEEHHKIILTPITHAYIDSFRGKYKGKRLLDALTLERAKER